MTGIEGEVITTQTLFQFVRQGIDAAGRAVGHFAWSGIRPRLMERIQSRGIDLPESLLGSDREGDWRDA